MKTLTVQSGELAQSSRLDAYFHLSEGRRLARHASGRTIRHERLGASYGIGALVGMPGRLKQIPALPGEASIPYLRPSDTLNYLPRASSSLSISRTSRIEDYKLVEGMLLVTRSGRNLGPTVYVDSYLACFVLSDDMIRVEIADETLRFYILGILGTATGQLLLRKDKSGSVIDHITVGHVASLDVPMLPGQAIEDVAQRMRRAAQLREEARFRLDRLQRGIEANLPAMPPAPTSLRHWSVSSSEMLGRLDAAPYKPCIRDVRAMLHARGGRPLGESAAALKPPGRYKTIYVDRDNGTPILSGGQLHQIRPLNPRYMATRALRGIERYRMTPGWTAYQADGRAEEALGEPVMIISNRDGWLASGHVGRLVAHDPADAGRVFLAFRTPHAQVQLKALASGSVVDATFPDDASMIVLPPLPEVNGQEVEKCWEKFSEAETIEDAAFQIIEEGLLASWG